MTVTATRQLLSAAEDPTLSRRLASAPTTPGSKPAPRPKPAPPKLRVPQLKVVPAGEARAALASAPIDPKGQVLLHPKGCRCTFHTAGGPWGIPRATGKAVPLLRGRKLVLYDVENQLGSPNATALDVAQTFRFTRSVLSLTRQDYVIFGMSHFAAARCAFALPTNQAALVLRSGPSGADLALIESVDLELLSKHFTYLVVVSNDYIFAGVAKTAKQFGMATWNVSSDMARISDETRAAYDGWTHLKLKAIREARHDKDLVRQEARAAEGVAER